VAHTRIRDVLVSPRPMDLSAPGVTSLGSGACRPSCHWRTSRSRCLQVKATREQVWAAPDFEMNGEVRRLPAWSLLEPARRFEGLRTGSSWDGCNRRHDAAQYQCFRPPISRPANPRMANTRPTTTTMTPIVQMIAIWATKPMISRMIPRTIKVLSLLLLEAAWSRERRPMYTTAGGSLRCSMPV
jgi:hypothetical protein